MKFLFGRKIEMTQKYRGDGTIVPVTLVKIDPCFVSQVKTAAEDGYDAVQIGGEVKKNINKPEKGHLRDLTDLKVLREFRISKEDAANYKKGDKIEVDVFEMGEKISISGYSKGLGFQGVVKKYKFAGHPASHGHKDQSKLSGSIGDKGSARVKKGRKMSGRMGGEKTTVHNIEIIEVNKKDGILALKGAVPGPRNGLILVYKK